MRHHSSGRWRRPRRLLAIAVILCGSAMSGACDRGDEHLERVGGGRADLGAAAIRKYGCGSCHTIPGIAGAKGLVGPPLAGVASRVYVGGVLTNSPDHMIAWIEHPRAWSPRTAMPELGVSHGDATNIASYLYTLK